MTAYTQARERTASWRKVSLKDQISEWELTQQVEQEVAVGSITACAKALRLSKSKASNYGQCDWSSQSKNQSGGRRA